MLEFIVKGRKGLSLIELLVVLLITSIVVVGFSVSASQQIKRTNRETVANEMQILASNISDAYYDLGNPRYDPDDDDDYDLFLSFLGTLSSDYTGFSFDEDSIEKLPRGFSVIVKEPLDTYENPYKFWFITNSDNRYVMIASSGDDGVLSDATYPTQNYGDDIVLFVKPKVTG